MVPAGKLRRPAAPSPIARTWRDGVVLLWPPVLALVLVAPLMVRPGHPLARDLVFVPRQPFTDATWGLGDVAPRAVPLDSVVAALTHVVDGGVLARVVLPLTLAVLGWGVAALLAPAGRTAQLAGSGFAVWNAYVVERLALGQWALLLGLAALPWLVAAGMRYRRSGRRVDLAAAIAWAALASLTPTGGLLALAGLVAACAPHLRRTGVVVAAGLALQAPWVVAALTGPGARVSDTSGVSVFAPDTGSPLGPVVALLGLGGIWDAGSEPATRTTWPALVAAVVVVVVLVAGVVLLRRAWGTGDTLRWVLLAAVLGGTAVLAATSWGEEVMVWLVGTVPGAGLLRDTQKLLAPVVVLAAAGFGACASRMSRALAGTDAHGLAVLVLAVVPVLLLPDATTETWRTVEPVALPGDLDRAADVLAGEDGVVVTLPWRSYRAFSWGHRGMTSSDPAIRMFDADVVTSDSLQVGAVLVPGESTLAARIGAALETGPPAESLPALGVAWVVVYPDDREAAQLDLAGLEPVLRGDDVEVYRVPGAASRPAPDSDGRRVAVWAAHLLALAVAGAAVLARAAGRPGRGHRADTDPRLVENATRTAS
ncbi:hypothetical protein Q9S36_41395 [Microbacterium sp. ARD31]|uniref:hypothetical protein n=1 Tax=Microbacterium sp. ARD31 TaxID=2962576 RepID=UPI0028823460|nr:hypothetical protein [Microbacterium sp. ARD31]MDT0186661.1 hypothetical protein [Microbacterium sp. ARD31]